MPGFWKKLTRKDRFVWWFPAVAALCGIAALFPLTLSSSELCAFLCVFVTIPLVSLALLLIAYDRQGGQCLIALSAFVLFLVFITHQSLPPFKTRQISV
jgi:hypothetical protein